MAGQRPRLAEGDGGQEVPQVVAVVQMGEATLRGAATDAIEGAEGHVLFVGGAAVLSPEPGAGQASQAAEIAIPEWGKGVTFAALEPRDVPGDRAVVGHREAAPIFANRVRSLIKRNLIVQALQPSRFTDRSRAILRGARGVPRGNEHLL